MLLTAGPEERKNSLPDYHGGLEEGRMEMGHKVYIMRMGSEP